jgi:DNA-binding NarL/FixJ family response regulator
MPTKILIVDDSDIVLQQLRSILGKYKDVTICAEARNGLDAVAQTMACHPDLVVMDFLMPGLNGLEAAARLKQHDPALPILMLTGFKDSFLEQQAYKAGITWVFSKKDEINKIPEFVRILRTPDAASKGSHTISPASQDVAAGPGSRH